MTEYLISSPDLRSGNPDIHFPGLEKVNTGMMPFALTVGDLGHKAASTNFRKAVFRDWKKLESVSGNRLGISNTSYFSTQANGFLNGAALRAYRYANGAFSLVHEDTISEWHARDFQIYFSMGPDEAADTETWFMSYGSNFSGDSTSWYVVASVANGLRSEWSEPVAYTSPSDPQIVSLTNSSVAFSAANGDSVPAVDPALNVPQNPAIVAEGGNASHLRMTWDATPEGQYIVRRCSFDPGVSTVNDAADISDASGLQAGDLLIIDKTFDPETPKIQVFDNRNAAEEINILNRFAWHTVDAVGPATIDVLESATSEAYYRVDVPSGSVRTLRLKPYGGHQQSFYLAPEVGETYEVRVRMRRVSGAGEVTVEVASGTLPETTVPLTSTMDEHVFSFVGTSEMLSEGFTYPVFLTVNGEAVVEIESIWTGRAEEGDVPFGLSEPSATVISDFAPSYLRTHSTCKTGPWTYTLDQLTDWNGYGEGQSLPRFMDIADEISAGLWLQIEPIFTDDEWRGLAEYFGADYNPATDSQATKPVAWKRYVTTGRTEAPIKSIPMKLETGNENWNFKMPYPMPALIGGVSAGTLMGAFLGYVLSVLKTSPYWQALEDNGFEIIPGGRQDSSLNGWALPQMEAFPEGRYVTMNLYNGRGWEENPQDAELLNYSDDYVAGVLQFTPTQWEQYFETWKSQLSELNEGRTVKAVLAGYEQNHTTPVLPSPGQDPAERAEQERTWKSKAVQTAIVDQFMSFALNGAELQCFFDHAFNGKEGWASFSPMSKGGAVVASFQWLGLINRKFMQDIHGQRPVYITRADVLDRDGNTVEGVAQTPVYYLEKGGALGIVAVNRRIPGHFMDADTGDGEGDGVTNAVLRVPPGYSSGTLWTMTGAYSDHNSTLATKDDLLLQSAALTSGQIETRDDGSILAVNVTVPPGDLVLVEFA